MQDKQNKGVGAYRDRPGYFMGGMIGGAILGALVNKIQGKDWKRGALWGGITGGITGGMTGEGGIAGWLGSTPGAAWLKKDPGMFKNMLSKAAPFLKNPWVQGAIGAGGASMMGDPEWERKKQEEAIERMREMQRARNIEQYGDWYVDPWIGWNKGGIINARPGYYNGGGAWSDVAGDEEVPGSYEDRVLSITGQSGLEGQGGLEDIMESFEMSSGPGQGDLSGWHEMFLDLQGKGEIPGDWDFNDFMENLGALDISPTDFSAQGGYKEKPQYAGGGIEDLDMTGGGSSFGPGTGTSDDIPAMLSDGEFVVTSDAVTNLGGGDRMLGARRMYSMMNQLDPNSQTPSEMSTVGIA
jgi:hypothetical protein